MAKFPIIRAKGTLPEIAPVARADIDVRTGAAILARGISALGESIEKFELMQASTELSEFKRKVREEHNRLAISYDGNLDPNTFKTEYEKSLAIRQGLIPKNRFAARAAREWLNDRMPIWAAGVEESRKARISDNFKAGGFELKTEAERTGDTSKYFQHLHIGGILDVYDKEQIAKLKQETTDNAERTLINELIRKGQMNQAFEAVNKSQLKQAEKRSLENTIRIARDSLKNRILSDSKKAANIAVEDSYAKIVDDDMDITSMIIAVQDNPTISSDDSNTAVVKIRTFFSTWHSTVDTKKEKIVTANSTRIRALKIKNLVRDGKLTEDEGLNQYVELEKSEKINSVDNKGFINDIFAASKIAKDVKAQQMNSILAEREKQLRDAIEKQQNILDPDIATEILKDFANIAVIEFNDKFREGDFDKNEVDAEVDRLMKKYTLSEEQQILATSARTLRLAETLKAQQEQITKIVAGMRRNGKPEEAKAIMDEAISLGIFQREGDTIKKAKGKKKVNIGRRLLDRLTEQFR